MILTYPNWDVMFEYVWSIWKILKVHSWKILDHWVTYEAYGSKQRPADAIVIGGGLAGMSASMALLDRGGSVVMVEKSLGSGGWWPWRDRALRPSPGILVDKWGIIPFLWS